MALYKVVCEVAGTQIDASIGFDCLPVYKQEKLAQMARRTLSRDFPDIVFGVVSVETDNSKAIKEEDIREELSTDELADYSAMHRFITAMEFEGVEIPTDLDRILREFEKNIEKKYKNVP